MASGESQDRSWVARGWEIMSFFVSFPYAFKASVKMASKPVEEMEVDGTWDILRTEGTRLDARDKSVARKG